MKNWKLGTRRLRGVGVHLSDQSPTNAISSFRSRDSADEDYDNG